MPTPTRKTMDFIHSQMFSEAIVERPARVVKVGKPKQDILICKAGICKCKKPCPICSCKLLK